MAESTFTFKLGSVFTGEGFNQCVNSVNSVNSEIKKATAEASKISSQLGGLDASASKAAQAVSGLANAILSGSATMATMSVSMVAINAYCDSLKEKAAAATEKMNALKSACDAAFSSTLKSNMAGVEQEIAKIADQFTSTTKAANQLAAAVNAINAAQGQGGVAQIAVDKLNALLEAHSEAERQNIEAEYNLLSATEAAKVSRETWQGKIEEAHNKCIEAENQIAAIDEQLKTVAENRKTIEEALAMDRENGGAKQKQLTEQINSLIQKEASLTSQQNDERLKLKLAIANEEKTIQEAENAELEKTAAVKSAKLAIKKLAEAEEEAEEQARRQSEQDAALFVAEGERQLAETEAAKAANEAAEASKKAAESAKSVTEAQNDYVTALGNYKRELLKSVLNTTVDGKSGKSGTVPVNVVSSISTQVSDAAVQDAIANGTINTVKDADRLQRQVMRETRDNINKGSGQRAQEAKKYERLMQTQPKNWSKQDADFVRKFEAIKNAGEAQKKKMEESKKATEKAKEDLDKILRKMNDLGMK